MPQAALNAMLAAYRAQVEWLLAQAEEFEGGHRQITARIGGKEVDVTRAYADEYRHKAGNMRAILDAFERLHAKSV
jgi:hypothetical protein